MSFYDLMVDAAQSGKISELEGKVEELEKKVEILKEWVDYLQNELKELKK